MRYPDSRGVVPCFMWNKVHNPLPPTSALANWNFEQVNSATSLANRYKVLRSLRSCAQCQYRRHNHVQVRRIDGPSCPGLAVGVGVALPPQNAVWPGRGLLDLAGLASAFRLQGHAATPLGAFLFREGYKDYLSPSYRASWGILRGSQLADALSWSREHGGDRRRLLMPPPDVFIRQG